MPLNIVTRRTFSILLPAALVAALVAPLAAAPPAQAPTTRRVIVYDSDKAGQKAVDQAGGRVIADYGAFALWETALTPGILALQAQSGDELTSIPLRGGQVIDTSAGRTTAAALSAASKEAGLWLVQFVGPIREEWLDGLTASGLRIVQYTPNNAYVVWGGAAALERLTQWDAGQGVVQWTGAYETEYRLAPALAPLAVAAQGAAAPVDVTVQLDAGATGGTGHVDALQSLAEAVLRPPSTVAGLTAVSVRLAADRLSEVAAWADVYNVEPYYEPEMLDEVQGQIVAGNVTGSNPVVPSGPGYLSWLASKGFPTTQASYVIVDVVDDGLDQGSATGVLHPDFHVNGNGSQDDRVASIQNCTTDSSGDGGDGHGNINAGIIGSYNNKAGSPHVDSLGYRIGLGISPYGRIASTKIFNNAGSYDDTYCSTSQAMMNRSYDNGASITSNSWGETTGLGAYDTWARDYDAFTRDASATTGGLQPMLHVFAAGNQGSGAGTIGSPGTAKNVLTVGATENVRDHYTADGCGVTSASNADDVINFSSRGPTDDGRSKPDIMAPGTHVQGPASQSPNYDGGGVCGNGGLDNRYYPLGQTLYTWSSGTSHSTPAVAGAAQLAWEYYQHVLRPGVTPSPAMVKALLINGARYLTGVSANDALPSPNQGWGDANLGMLTDGVARRLVDQADSGATFTESGQSYALNGHVTDTSKPVRVTLAWSDAPGPTTGSKALVNDLDLEVTVDGTVYRGNVFSGRDSTTGGSFDRLNNVENVFLPAGTSGLVQVRVIAYNVAADGVPQNLDDRDQDFALVACNVGESPTLMESAVQRTIAPGDGDVLIEPGETVAVTVELENAGTSAASGVSGSMSLLSTNATLGNALSPYPNIAASGTGSNTTPYSFTVDADASCGSAILLEHDVTYNSTQHYTHTVSFIIGSAQAGTAVDYPYTGSAVPIPDADSAVVSLSVPTLGTVADVDVRVNLTHPFDGDLVLTLVSPSGTEVELSSLNGSSGDNYTNTVLDDEASTSIASGTPPFTGSFRPEGLLSSLDGEPMAGTWTLRVEDTANIDTGTLLGWSVDISPLDVDGCNRPAQLFLPILLLEATQ